MREYQVMINGLPHRQMLTDETAKRLGDAAKPVEEPRRDTAKVVEPETERERPRRSRTARTKG